MSKLASGQGSDQFFWARISQQAVTLPILLHRLDRGPICQERTTGGGRTLFIVDISDCPVVYSIYYIHRDWGIKQQIPVVATREYSTELLHMLDICRIAAMYNLSCIYTEIGEQNKKVLLL